MIPKKSKKKFTEAEKELFSKNRIGSWTNEIRIRERDLLRIQKEIESFKLKINKELGL